MRQTRNKGQRLNRHLLPKRAAVHCSFTSSERFCFVKSNSIRMLPCHFHVHSKALPLADIASVCICAVLAPTHTRKRIRCKSSSSTHILCSYSNTQPQVHKRFHCLDSLGTHQYTSVHVSTHQYTSVHISTSQYTCVDICMLYVVLHSTLHAPRHAAAPTDVPDPGRWRLLSTALRSRPSPVCA